MSLVLSDSDVLATGLTEAELRLELAVALFVGERISMGRGARVAGMPLAQFMEALAERKISPHYGLEELREDFAEVERLSGR